MNVAHGFERRGHGYDSRKWQGSTERVAALEGKGEPKAAG